VSYPVQAQLIDGGGNAIGTTGNPIVMQSTTGTAANPVIVQESPTTAETILSITGTQAIAGDTTIIAAVAGLRIRVFALSIFAPSGTSPVTLTLTDGPAGPALWTAVVQAPNQAAFTFGQATHIPTFLFATSAGKALVMNLSAATVSVTANLSYWTA
jgi:hypothetical protein